MSVFLRGSSFNRGFITPVRAPILRSSQITHHKLSRIISHHLNHLNDNATTRIPVKSGRFNLASIQTFKLRPAQLPYSGIHKPSRRRKRTRTPFHANRTISRSIVEAHTHQFKLPRINREDISACEELYDRLEDHAYRRLQIFYYQCVAYYNEKCSITLGHTIHQHGISSCQGCSAAHSSILPALNDNLLPGKMWKGILSEDCHLYHVMNSTVEVPNLVNTYDTIIEKNMRPKALEILNEVSQGLRLPYEAMQAMEQKLQEFFKVSESETMQKIQIFKSIQKCEERLNALEIMAGTKQMIEKKDWIREYLQLLWNIRKFVLVMESMKGFSLHFKEDWSNCRPMAVLEAVINLHQKELQSIELAFAQEGGIERLFHWLLESVFSSPGRMPFATEERIEKLEESLIICHLQEQGSRRPALEVLSGRVSDLAALKLQLWRRE